MHNRLLSASLSRKLGENASALLLVLPALLVFAVFLVRPFIGTLFLSLQKWDGASSTKTFVGLGNYQFMLKDSVFWVSLSHNVLWTVMSVVLPVSTGFFLALLIAGKTRAKIVFRTVFFMPGIVSFIAVSIVWGWIYHPSFGIVNVILRAVGLGTIARGWLGDYTWALPAVVLSANWTYYGFCMVVFLAALGAVDINLYDAAKIDGANARQVLVHVTIPQLRNTIMFTALITMINSLKTFDLVYVMTSGGPGNRTEVLATYLFKQAFKDVHVGYGSALSVSLTLLIFTISALSLTIQRYENE